MEILPFRGSAVCRVARALTTTETEALLACAYRKLNRMRGAGVADVLDICEDYDYQSRLFEGLEVELDTPDAKQLLYPTMLALYFINDGDESKVTEAACLALVARVMAI